MRPIKERADQSVDHRQAIAHRQHIEVTMHSVDECTLREYGCMECRLSICVAPHRFCVIVYIDPYMHAHDSEYCLRLICMLFYHNYG